MEGSKNSSPPIPSSWLSGRQACWLLRSREDRRAPPPRSFILAQWWGRGRSSRLLHPPPPVSLLADSVRGLRFVGGESHLLRLLERSAWWLGPEPLLVSAVSTTK